jgi:lysozyme family protein
MKNNFESCLEFVLHHEGGWADHPKDPGGATMKGVTLAVYRSYLGRNASKEELRSISQEHLFDIYKSLYWDKAKCDDLAVGVDLVVFDMAVNSGVGRASKILQSCVGAVPDGAIGPKTMALVNGIPAKDIIVKFSDGRENFYKSLSTFDTFGKGWLRRTKECEIKALLMIGEK